MIAGVYEAECESELASREKQTNQTRGTGPLQRTLRSLHLTPGERRLGNGLVFVCEWGFSLYSLVCAVFLLEVYHRCGVVRVLVLGNSTVVSIAMLRREHDIWDD